MSGKTFAVLTDIHSNLESFNSAMSIIEERGNVDQIVCIGDYFALGPAPKETLQKLLAMEGAIVLRGNHERYQIERLWEQDRPTLEGMNPDDQVTKDIVANEKWTCDQIGEKGIDYIRTMNIAHREIVGKTLIEFTHAWYHRDEEPPTMEEALNWRDHVQAAHPEVDRFVFIHGHAHIPREESTENLTIYCQGATGLPFDKDQRAAVAFLNVDGDVSWDVVRYEYDHQATIDLLEDRKPPFYRNLQNTIRYAEIRNDL